MESLMEKTIQTNSFLGSKLIMILIMLLHISFSIKELLRNMIYTPGCNLIEVGKLVLILNVD